MANKFSLTSSYHSIITALENSGWLSNLGMSAVSKFVAQDIPKVEFLTIKGDVVEIIEGEITENSPT